MSDPDTPKGWILLAKKRVDPLFLNNGNTPRLYTPGDYIVPEEGLMRGHGTYVEDESMKASLVGVKRIVNKLVSIKPFTGRYEGEVGDVIIGRIVDIEQKKWVVEINSKLDAFLLLSSICLPGGELRKRSFEDEQMMSTYLEEGDVISAEVQNIHADGVLHLHTRSLKYGKLAQGILLEVPSVLVKKTKTHFHNLPCGVSIILGCNGYIWLCPLIEEKDQIGGFAQNLKIAITRTEREAIARVQNCIFALVESKMMLYYTTISYAYEESQQYDIRDLLEPSIMAEIALAASQREQTTEAE